MRQEVFTANGLKTGVSRIDSFGPDPSLGILPPLLDKFRQQCPLIDISENTHGLVIKPLNPPIIRSIAFALNDEHHSSPATKAFLKLAKSMYCN